MCNRVATDNGIATVYAVKCVAVLCVYRCVSARRRAILVGVLRGGVLCVSLPGCMALCDSRGCSRGGVLRVLLHGCTALRDSRGHSRSGVLCVSLHGCMALCDSRGCFAWRCSVRVVARLHSSVRFSQSFRCCPLFVPLRCFLDDTDALCEIVCLPPHGDNRLLALPPRRMVR